MYIFFFFELFLYVPGPALEYKLFCTFVVISVNQWVRPQQETSQHVSMIGQSLQYVLNMLIY